MALPIAQYTSMPLPTAEDEGGRTVGGVAIKAAVVSIEEKPKARKRGERTGDKKKRACRTCKRCKANKGADGKTCRGRHPCNSSAKCEFFDAVGEKIPAQQDIDEEGGASAKKAAKKYTVA
jgi:hypothetical protein